MSEYILKRGLDIPVSGSPEQTIYPGPTIPSIAVMGPDFIGLKPKMLIQEGDEVERGTPLFCHKDSPKILYVSPSKGRVRAILRGARRVLQSVVIDVSDASEKGISFVQPNDLDNLSPEAVRDALYTSGLWTSFLTRPYSKVPDVSSQSNAIFVTAIDTEPLAPKADLIIKAYAKDFAVGVQAIAKLSSGKIHLCHHSNSPLPEMKNVHNVETHSFDGPHPAGLAGTHMHFIDVPSASKNIWTIGYQDVIAIGKLFQTGHLDPTRVISLAGPLAANPRLLKVMAGSSLQHLLANEIINDEPCRVISGSILTGRHAQGPLAYLGRYARQITLMKEDEEQLAFGWIKPQPNKFSAMPVLASALRKARSFNLTSNLNGGRRAMVPTGIFETLMPQDFLPTQLLRSLIVMDTETAQALGALELDEEDLALCTFACPAKYEYGEALRDNLQKIEKEG